MDQIKKELDELQERIDAIKTTAILLGYHVSNNTTITTISKKVGEFKIPQIRLTLYPTLTTTSLAIKTRHQERNISELSHIQKLYYLRKALEEL